jgi:hypothetical protein
MLGYYDVDHFPYHHFQFIFGTVMLPFDGTYLMPLVQKSWNPETLLGIQLVKKDPGFMEPEDLPPYSPENRNLILLLGSLMKSKYS